MEKRRAARESSAGTDLSAEFLPGYLGPMRFENAEDRLNPVTPDDADESTLGGYLRVHGRAAAFEGSDGRPYTVAVEAERSDDESGWFAYLVFLRWADTGTAIMGHMETGDLASGSTEEEARAELEKLALPEVKALLDAVIEASGSE
jgi:hypothetical protein